MRLSATSVILACPALNDTLTARFAPPAPVRAARVVADVADLLACAHAGLADVVLIGADLPGVDRACVDELRELELNVIGIAAAEPDSGVTDQALSELGVSDVVPVTCTPADLLVLLERPARSEPAPVPAEPPAARTAATVPSVAVFGTWREITTEALAPVAANGDLGRIVAVWGPTGAPGRSTIAAGLAALVSASRSCLLIDLDPYGGIQTHLFGLPDEGSGLAAAVHAAGHGRLDRDRLAALACTVEPGLAVLTGLPHARGWTRIRPTGLRRVLQRARREHDVVVLDCGFCLEEDEELSYDTRAPRRNAATVTALQECDDIVVVAGADRVGLTRLADALPMAQHLLDPRATWRVVLNRVRPVCVPPAEQGWHDELLAFADPADVHLVPQDLEAFDAALAAGRPIPWSAPRAESTLALARLARDLTATARRV